MKKSLHILLLYGGQSSEHDVSVTTAEHFFQNYTGKYVHALEKIFITKEGKWMKENQEISISAALEKADLVIPILHGQYGEDGRIQGLLEMMYIPYIGTSLQGSVVGFDKILSKKLVRDAGLLVPDFLVITKEETTSFDDISRYLGSPFFLKPARTGSSVGIEKVANKKEFKQAKEIAFQHDERIICEQAVSGREIEVGVIGFGNDVQVSVTGEIITPENHFYDYEQKYAKDSQTTIQVPAELSLEMTEQIRETAHLIYTTLHCDGMARVDFFVTEHDEIIFNEVNTIPGPVMFTKLWQASGVSFSELIDLLIEMRIKNN